VLRVADVRTHPAAIGLPSHHPQLGPFLAVPLLRDSEVLGELIVANRAGRPQFSHLDETLARHLGTLVVAAMDSARMQSAVSAERNRMADLERAKSQFLNLASHELRGPITVMRGYLSMLEDGSLGSTPPAQVLELLSAKARQIDLLVTEMIEAARMEEGRLRLDIEPTDLRDVLDVAVREVRPLAVAGQRIRLRAGGVPIVVSGDRRRLDDIVSNLLDNAIKYSPEGQDVHCEATIRGGSAVIRIRDQGLGIAEADMPRLFTRFGRILTEANSHIPGTGLGLWLARELARLHGGDISVVSRLGAGSTFTLTLPLLRAADAQALASPMSTPKAAGGDGASGRA
jgi:signal transduction histidine kinase